MIIALTTSSNAKLKTLRTITAMGSCNRWGFIQSLISHQRSPHLLAIVSCFRLGQMILTQEIRFKRSLIKLTIRGKYWKTNWKESIHLHSNLIILLTRHGIKCLPTKPCPRVRIPLRSSIVLAISLAKKELETRVKK